MVKAVLNDIILAESDETKEVEGNIYFPEDSIKVTFDESQTHSTCPWKGVASYHSFSHNGSTIKDIAWYYPNPKEKAMDIKNYVAFYKNKVTIA